MARLLIPLLLAALTALLCVSAQFDIPNFVECPNVAFTSKANDPETLLAWTSDDWDPINGYDISNGKTVAEKTYLYDSSLVLPAGPGQLFREDYALTNERFEFPDGTSPGVPGPFSYAEGYEHWGGDETLIGKTRYSEIIGHFGHTHILSVHAKIAALRRSTCGSTVSQDLMLDHLLEGSTQIFAWYGTLVDVDGNRTPNSGHPYWDQIRQLMAMLIYGEGAGPNGEIDLNVFFGAVQGFLQLATPSHPNYAMLQAEAGRLQAFLGETLQLGGTNPIPLLAWHPLMADHQKGTTETFLRYREVYRTNPNHPSYPDILARAGRQHIHCLRHGPQMAAFFGTFYSFTNFLDKFFYSPVDSEYAIPPAIMDANINYVQKLNKDRWVEHVVMFGDYNKAAALGDEAPGVEDRMFKIQINMLDSCTHIAGSVGEIFARFDRLIRYRNIQDFVTSIPLPPA